MRLFLIIFSLLFSCNLLANQQETYAFNSTQDAYRFHALTSEIRCVVCQNQNIADSNAPLANDLREKVYRMVMENKSNDEIKNYLVKRYGEFILLNPRLSEKTALLWFFPLIAMSFIFLLFWQRLRKTG